VLISSLKKCLKWKDGDEIILSVVGFPTTLAPIIQNNLAPAFVDIELDTLNFDINLIEEKISSKTKAILISPVLGNSPNMDELAEMATKYKLELILDNCDSLGSKWKGKYLSEYCIASTCSFYPAHHMCTGEGGMVSSNNKEIIRTAQSIAWWGRDCYCVGIANLLSDGTCKKRFDYHIAELDMKIDHKYVFANIGYNLKPLDLQGAIGNIQLKKFDEIHRKRKENKEKNQFLLEKHINDIIVPNELEFADTSWFGTPIICKTREIKELLVSFLENNKIQTRNYFAGNILIHPAYNKFGDSKKYPNANEVLYKVLFIGAAPHYNESIFAYIEEVLRKWKN
jgi:CDP-6-deoxy-D-xylo-4-hexulose-3-dehydrase